jgi:cell division protein ZipA
MEAFIRYTLMSIGVLILVFIFWISVRRKKQQHEFLDNNDAQPFDQVFFDDESDDLQDTPIEDEIEEVDALEDEPEEWAEDVEIEAADALEDEPEEWVDDVEPEFVDDIETAPQEALSKGPDDFVQIPIVAKPGKTFGGYDLLQTLTANHFHFGDMNIFHYHRDMNPSATKLFSLASMQQPGDFDLDKIGLFKTKGLVLFMNRAEHPEHADHIYELMEEVAYQLAEDLDGEVKR